MRKNACLLIIILIFNMSLYGCSSMNDNSNEKYSINNNGNYSNNIADKGFIAKQGDWIFYYSTGGFLGIGEGLYKSKENGMNKKKIVSGTISNINVLGDWIYFILEEKNTINSFTIINYNLYKIRLDGSQKSLVANDCNNINVIKDTIYYRICVDVMGYQKAQMDNYPLKDEDGDVYTMKLDGSQKKLIIKNAWRFIINGEYIYYSIDGSAYRSNIDGTDAKKIIQNVGDNFKVENNIIYYTTKDIDNFESNVHIVDLSSGTTKNIIVKDKRLMIINPYKGDIYYTTSNFQLYKINSNGLSEKIAEDILYFYIFDDDIYIWSGEREIKKLN